MSKSHQTSDAKVFHIPVPFLNRNAVLVYAPLSDMLFVAEQSFSEELKKALGGISSNSQANEIAADILQAEILPAGNTSMRFSNLTILPTNRCNFNCQYCYSAQSRSTSHQTISSEQLQQSLYLFLRRIDPGATSLAVTFYGGGEPLLAWERIQETICFLENNFNGKVYNKIITNGSLLDEKMVRYLMCHNTELTISYDILPEMQNKYRGHFDLVTTMIKKCCDWGIVPEINSVVTQDNVACLKDMLEFAGRELPMVKYFHFEPVISQEMFPQPEKYTIFLKNFLDNFLNCQELLFNSDKELSCSFFKKLVKNASRFCPVDFVITPTGEISGCPCISSSAVPGYDFYLYGQRKNEEIDLDFEKFQQLLAFDNSCSPACNQCIARWNCAGGCLHRNRTMNEACNKILCNFMREFTIKGLLQKLDFQYRREYGKTLKELLHIAEETE